MWLLLLETESLRNCLILGFIFKNFAMPCQAEGIVRYTAWPPGGRGEPEHAEVLGGPCETPKGGNKTYKSKIKLEKEIPYLSYSTIPKYL